VQSPIEPVTSLLSGEHAASAAADRTIAIMARMVSAPLKEPSLESKLRQRLRASQEILLSVTHHG
jgi:hypothetical protein